MYIIPLVYHLFVSIQFVLLLFAFSLLTLNVYAFVIIFVLFTEALGLGLKESAREIKDFTFLTFCTAILDPRRLYEQSFF